MCLRLNGEHGKYGRGLLDERGQSLGWLLEGWLLEGWPSM